MSPKKIPRAAASKDGFALVVTLTLMILLSILAVGMLGLSSGVLRTSSQSDSQAGARANARMALMMAIAELQKELGPDARISAPSDAGTVVTGGQPNWTAVYDAWQWNADSSMPETPLTRSPKFRGWLVSGANQVNGGPAGTGEFATLVGSASLSATAKPQDQINAPMLAVTRGNRKGRIAWWTADESVKAKINAGGEAPLASNPLSDSQSPRNVGHKAIDELAGFDWKQGQRSISVSTGGVNLAAGLGIAGLGRLSHDVTVHSAGLLADVRQGRLKLDLSNLLSRSATELQDKPLYTADGRINRFQIAADGSLTNNLWVTANGTGANRWGINLEELHLFHEIHREVDWSGGKPKLVNKGTTDEMIQDRFFMYRRPSLEAVSLILSFIASPEAGTAPTTYRIDAMMDTIVAVSNPNDIPVVWPASVLFRVDTEGFPYSPRWNIRTAAGAVRRNHQCASINVPFFRSSISNGFTLESGEAAVFGASTADTQSRNVNLTRGFVPRGGVRINEQDWSTDSVYQPTIDGLRCTGLLPDDIMDFTMTPSNFSNGNTPSGWISSYSRMRNTSGGGDIGMSSHRLGGGGNSVLSTAPTSNYMLAAIRPAQRPRILDFIGAPLPVIIVTTMSNVERSRTTLQPPNAISSRPYLLHEPATSNMVAITNPASNTELTMHNSQLITISEPMDYVFGNDRTMAAGTGGRNLYHGGGREPGLGGGFNVVKRRIPLTAPLSLGAFENAIACGFVQRYTGGSALSSLADILTTLPAPGGGQPRATKVTLAKSIGNSWSNPFLTSDLLLDSNYHDASWMANTALWDSFYLSGVVAPGASAAWNNDNRSQRQQFSELAERTATLRNSRLTYHPHKATSEALDELFIGDVLRAGAIEKLSKYLLVDGAFNVNSTSARAWKAFLTSVREQELLDANGAASKKTHPFGTLGHAVKSATTGTEGDWNGFRDLSDSDIDRLAKAIVTEVKARGPFLNMADFVNRRPNSSDLTQRAMGALQAAIDKSGINNRFTTAGRSLAAADVPMLAGKDTLVSEPAPARALGAAGFLSQGALLTAFGSQITVRGDTFLIRTYGDSRDAAGIIQAKAWCEAVVQRTPEYVDPTNPPEAATGLAPANTTFGRKFNIVSFRWLSQNEI